MSKEITHVDWFGGIGGFSHGFEQAGIRTVAYSEIEPYARAVFESRWPGVPNLGCVRGVDEGWPHLDIRKHDKWVCPERTDNAGLADGQRQDDGQGLAARWNGLHPVADEDDLRSATIWTAGSPCQDVSVAGQRAGLTDADGSLTRSGLALTFLDLVREHRPSWVIIENVPGLLSSNKGRDLAVILDSLAESGYGWAYRILDARFFGVAQRRRRIFIVATCGPGGDIGARRAAEVLSIGQSGTGYSAAGDEARTGTPEGVARSLTASSWKRHDEDTDTLVERIGVWSEPEPGIVRRLTPTEAELLQGFPLGYTIPDPARWKYEPDPDYPLLPRGLDSARYRVLGNAVCASVTAWLGHRLASMIANKQEQAA